VECDQYVQKDVFTTEEACLFLDISPSQLYKLTSKQKIPHYKPRGKMVYFDKKELVKWLKRNHKNEVLVNDTE
jgi:excisionase family DNA binding protein